MRLPIRLPFVTRPPAPERPVAPICIDIGDRVVEVAVRRDGRAKSYRLRVTARADGAVVTIPRRGSRREAEAFVRRHGAWLADRLGAGPPPGIAEGHVVPLRGVLHRVRLTGRLRGLPQTGLDEDGTAVLLLPGAAGHLDRRLRDFLKAEARRDLEEAVARHAATLGVSVTAICLRDPVSRWGSASSRGRLSFSWRLILAPPFVLDYLAAHEVAHLVEMNHSDRFWAICRRLAPRSEEARGWLHREGRALHRAV